MIYSQCKYNSKHSTERIVANLSIPASKNSVFIPISEQFVFNSVIILLYLHQ